MQCDSEVESEDDGWPGTENHWCNLLDLSYHYFVGPLLLGFMKELDLPPYPRLQSQCKNDVLR